VFAPVIVTPYKGDTYKLIEGERRWTSARMEGVKELPAIVVNRMNDYEEQVVMFHIHNEHRGWKPAEEMNAIERIVETNPDKTDEELSAELSMTLSQFRDRRRVLAMGPEVRAAIARGEMDYYAALRADQVAKQISRDRPEWTEEHGGDEAVRTKIFTKVKKRGPKSGIVRELETVRRDIKDREEVPSEVLTKWVEEPETSLGEARKVERTLPERRAVDEVVKDVRKIGNSLRRFDVDLYEAPNLADLRRALSSLIDVAQALEEKILTVSMQKVTA
jgi:ParB/RepB/Spo0J family partition protein